MDPAVDACVAPALFDGSSPVQPDYQNLLSTIEHDWASYEQRVDALPRLQPAGSFVQRLKAASPGAEFNRRLRCLQPRQRLDRLQRRHAFDRDLIELKLKRGRACNHELCSASRCGLHVFDGIITPDEAAALVSHAEGVLDAERASARDVAEHWPYVRVDFMRSAHNGSRSGHLLSLRVAERMRRLAAKTFELPLEKFASEARAEYESGGSESQYHCDEALAPHFHFSTIVWLSESGVDFDGGELEFLHNRSWAWMVVEPKVGRAALFSSGWENVHGIKPLLSGTRWALSVPLMVSDAFEPVREEARAAEFFERCVSPADKWDYQRCRGQWAAVLDAGRRGGAASARGRAAE